MKFVAWNNIKTDEPATERQKVAIRNLYEHLDWKLPRMSRIMRTTARDLITAAIAEVEERNSLADAQMEFWDQEF